MAYHPKRSTTSALTINAVEMAIKAYELRRKHLSYRDIAAELGISSSYAHYLVTGYLNAARDKVAELAAEVKDLEIARLDALAIKYWERAESGDDSALDRYLKISERRAKLLGLDAPKQIQVGEGPSAKDEPDLSRLTQEELDAYERLLVKAHGDD